MGFMANPDGTFTRIAECGLGGGYKMGVLVDGTCSGDGDPLLHPCHDQDILPARKL